MLFFLKILENTLLEMQNWFYREIRKKNINNF